MRLVVYIVDVLVVSASAWMLVWVCRVRGWVPRAVAFLVGLYALLVLGTPLLSASRLLASPWAHLGVHLVMGLALLLVARGSGCVWPSFAPRGARSPLRFGRTTKGSHGCPKAANSALFTWRRALQRWPDLVILTLVVLVVYAVNAWVAVAAAKNSWDGLAYHLARVGYWLQHGHFEPFGANSLPQTVFPMNSSLVMLWLTLPVGHDGLTGLVQYVAVLGGGLVVYGLGRQLRYARAPAAMAALLWLTFPVALVQSTTVLNDMVVAFLMAAAVYLLLLGMSRRHMGYLLISGIAVGAAVGTKVTAILFGPCLLLIACVSTMRRPGAAMWRRMSCWVASCLLGIGLLAGPLFVQNMRAYAHPLGLTPATERVSVRVKAPSWRTLCSNGFRLAFDFVDTTGLPRAAEARLQAGISAVGRRLSRRLGIDPYGPEGTVFGGSFMFYTDPHEVPGGPYRDRRQDHAAWMGPLGVLLLLPCVMMAALGGVGLRLGRRRGTAATLSWAVLGYVTILAFVLQWSPWRGRYVALGALIVAPLMAGAVRPGRRWIPLRMLVVLLACSVAVNTVATCIPKPLIGAHAFRRHGRVAQQCRRARPMVGVLTFVAEMIPKDAWVGSALFDWDYPLFGRCFSRRVSPVRLLPVGDALRPSEAPDYLVVGRRPQAVDPDRIEGYTCLWHGQGKAVLVRSDHHVVWQHWADDRTRCDMVDGALPPLIEIDPTLRERVGIFGRPRYSAWGVEEGRLVWLGDQPSQSLGIECLVAAPVSVGLSFAVHPGPGRHDRVRRLRLSLEQGDDLMQQDVVIEQSTTVTFPVDLQAGHARINLTVLDEATVTEQPNGDTRPLMLMVTKVGMASSADAKGPTQK